MCLAFEITMTIAGVVVLILGKITLSSELRLSGWRARVAGLLLVLPLPLIYGLGLILGTLIGLQAVPESAAAYFSAFEYVLVASMPVAVVLFAFLSKPRLAAPAAAVTAEVQAHLTEGQHWLELGYDGRAVNSFEAAIRANPRCLEAYELLAEVHRCREDWQECVRILQAALELDPRRAVNHYRISLGYARLGHSEQAERERKITLQLDPSYPQAADVPRMNPPSYPSQTSQGEST